MPIMYNRDYTTKADREQGKITNVGSTGKFLKQVILGSVDHHFSGLKSIYVDAGIVANPERRTSPRHDHTTNVDEEQGEISEMSAAFGSIRNSFCPRLCPSPMKMQCCSLQSADNRRCPSNTENCNRLMLIAKLSHLNALYSRKKKKN